MKTIRAKELTKNCVIWINNVREIIDQVDITRRGNVMVWLNDGERIKFFDPLDVVVIE